jgi:hypothetical protein
MIKETAMTKTIGLIALALMTFNTFAKMNYSTFQERQELCRNNLNIAIAKKVATSMNLDYQEHFLNSQGTMAGEFAYKVNVEFTHNDSVAVLVIDKVNIKATDQITKTNYAGMPSPFLVVEKSSQLPENQSQYDALGNVAEVSMIDVVTSANLMLPKHNMNRFPANANSGQAAQFEINLEGYAGCLRTISQDVRN